MEKIKLNYPIEVQEEEGRKVIDELTLTRLKVKHLRKLPASFSKANAKAMKVEEIIPFIAIVCGITEDVCDEIDVADLEQVIEKISDFLEGATGQ